MAVLYWLIWTSLHPYIYLSISSSTPTPTPTPKCIITPYRAYRAQLHMTYIYTNSIQSSVFSLQSSVFSLQSLVFIPAVSYQRTRYKTCKCPDIFRSYLAAAFQVPVSRFQAIVARSCFKDQPEVYEASLRTDSFSLLFRSQSETLPLPLSPSRFPFICYLG